MLEMGQWATPVPVSASCLQLLVIEVDAVGVPDVAGRSSRREAMYSRGRTPQRSRV